MLENWPYANVEPQKNEHELYSAAVSLKRIADALEKQNEIAICAVQGFPQEQG